MRRTRLLTAGLVWGLASLQGCESPDQPVLDVPFLALQHLDPALCAFDRGGFTLTSTNAFFPIGVGSEWVLEGEEAGALTRLQITVLDQTEIVGGVTTRVVEERESAEGALVEVSRNFFAEASDGTVCYFGEEVDIYENGQIVSHEGAWRADAPGNRAGIIMPADPRRGMTFQMEGAPGVAEDQGTIKTGGRIRVPAGDFKRSIRVKEFNPLDGGTSLKVFAKGVGLVIDDPLKLTTFQLP
jgi:hypothetical protein